MLSINIYDTSAPLSPENFYAPLEREKLREEGWICESTISREISAMK
jgi:hypothetical protein